MSLSWLLEGGFLCGEQLDEFFHCGGKDATLAVNEGKGAPEIVFFKWNDFEEILSFLACDCRLGENGEYRH